MKVTRLSQGINPSGSCSYRAQHVTQHEGVNAVYFRDFMMGFP